MPGSSIFLDTNGWVALLNAGDALHGRAAAAWQEIGGAAYSVVLTDWIVAETGNTLARTAARKIFPEAFAAIQESARSRLVFVDSFFLEEAVRRYRNRGEQNVGPG